MMLTVIGTGNENDRWKEHEETTLSIVQEILCSSMKLRIKLD